MNACQRRERLLGSLVAGHGVYGDHDAARAGLDHRKPRTADLHVGPCIFVPGAAPLDHDVRSKSLHGERLSDHLHQVVQRGLLRDEIGKTIRKADLP